MILDPLNLFSAGGWEQYQISGMTHSDLDVRKIGPKLWEMRSNPGCMYKWEWDQGNCALLVPFGYRSDGASVPKPYRGIVDPEGAFDEAWPHDLIYDAHGGDRQYKVWNEDGTFRLESLTDAVTDKPMTISRSRADALLYCGWVSNGMRHFEAVAGYDAVRRFGDHAWDLKV